METTSISPADSGNDLATLTEPELRALLTDDASRLAGARRSWHDARDGFAHRVALAESDATRDAIIAERLPRLEAAERATGATASAVERNARAMIAATDHAPLAITDDQLERAASLAPFIARDVERLRAPELRDRLRHALMADDRATLWLFTRELPDRLTRERAQPGTAPGAQAAVSEINRLLGEARDRLADRSLDPIRTRATEILHQAQDLARDASRRQREAASVAERERTGAVAWPS